MRLLGCEIKNMSPLVIKCLIQKFTINIKNKKNLLLFKIYFT